MQDTNDSSSTDIREDEFLSGLRTSDDGKLVGPVKLTAKVSRGGMGVVYRGRHLKLDIDVAVKFLFPHLAEDNPEYVVRFEREARMAAKLNNENLVRVFDVDSEEDYHYVVMELVCGETARDRVLRKGPLADDEAIEILCGAARGLQAAHRSGIVHRDIKPDNVMIDASGLVKLADLGIAKTVQDPATAETDLTQAGLVMGTPSFMPPEQLRDARSVGFSGDVYSMGATLYFLLTGKPPFSGSLYEIFEKITRDPFPDVRDERPDVSDATVRILDRCTRRDPAARYADATALLEALEANGAGARRIGDPLTGTVTAVAKVSTPPARRLGEIRLKVTSATPAPTAPRAKTGRSRALSKTALAVVLAGAALATAYFVTSPGGRVSTLHDVAESDESAPPPVGVPEPEPQPERVTEPEAVAEIQPAPPTVISSAPSELPRENDTIAEERQKNQIRLIARTRQLIELRDTRGALNILASQDDWGSFAPEAFALELRALLRARPARADEAVALYEKRYSERPSSASADSVTSAGYTELLEHAALLPTAQASAAVWSVSLAFWRGLPAPPEHDPELRRLRGEVALKLRSAYLTTLLANAKRAMASQNVPEARGALEDAARFARDEGIEGTDVPELEELRALLRGSDPSSSE